jgi:hypothetical protein
VPALIFVWSGLIRAGAMIARNRARGLFAVDAESNQRDGPSPRRIKHSICFRRRFAALVCILQPVELFSVPSLLASHAGSITGTGLDFVVCGGFCF